MNRLKADVRPNSRDKVDIDRVYRTTYSRIDKMNIQLDVVLVLVVQVTLVYVSVVYT